MVPTEGLPGLVLSLRQEAVKKMKKKEGEKEREEVSYILPTRASRGPFPHGLAVFPGLVPSFWMRVRVG